MIVHYMVTSGDWCIGTHSRYNSYEEAKKEYETCKENSVYGSLKKVTIKGFLKKNIFIEEIESFSIVE